MADIQEEEQLVEFMVKNLVDAPDKVSVESIKGEKSTIIEVRCDKDDIGKIIGKRGKIAQALRTILNAAATKAGHRVILEILARVVRQEDAPLVVVDGEPSADSAPLAPSSVERTALDRVNVLTRAKAAELGIQVKKPRTGFQLEQSGPAGQVFATLADKFADALDATAAHYGVS